MMTLNRWLLILIPVIMVIATWLKIQSDFAYIDDNPTRYRNRSLMMTRPSLHHGIWFCFEYESYQFSESGNDGWGKNYVYWYLFPFGQMLWDGPPSNIGY